MGMRKVENKIYQIFSEGKDNGFYFETRQGLLDGPYGFAEEAKWQKDFKEKGIRKEREENQFRRSNNARTKFVLQEKLKSGVL